MKKLLLFLFLFSSFFTRGQVTIGVQDFETSPATPTLGITSSPSFTTQTGNTSSTADLPSNVAKFVSGTQGIGTINSGTNGQYITFNALNTSSYSGVSITFRLASISIGALTNGAESTDFVDIETSTDGTTWSKELRVTGSTSNNAVWSFANSGTSNALASASKAYDGNNNFETAFAPTGTGANTAGGIGTVTLTGLPSVPSLYIRILCRNNSANELWILDDVAVKGTLSFTPTLILSQSSISYLNYLVGNGPSAASSYNVSGTNLTPASGDITVTAPTNFEVSTASNGTFTDNLPVSYTGGALNPTPVFVRLKTGLTAGGYGGSGINIANTGGGAATVNVTVSGTVTTGAECGAATNIVTVRAAIPEQSSYTGTPGVTISGTVTAIFGANKIYLQDATGGIAIFQTGIVTNNGITLGDLIKLTGTPARFNGEAELITTTCVIKLSSGSVPSPVIFDSNTPPSGVNLATFLDANEGKRIKIISANLVSTGTFTASTNYPITACNGQGDTEIRIDVAASQTLTGTTIPTVTQDITGVIGHYITATGTVNILQVFPSSPTHFSNSAITCVPVIIPAAASCGPLAASTMSADSTLDVTAWNVEWLGNTTTSPSALGPTNDAQQMTNVMSVLNTIKADVFCVEEVCDHNQFIARVGTDLPGYGVSCQTAYYSHFFDTPETPGNATTYSQKVCFVYKTALVSLVPAETKSLLSDVYVYTPPTGPNNWASGRLPYLFVANVTIGGKTKKIHFVGLHAKSGSAVADYNRRNQDIIDLKAKLDSNTTYANANIIMLGDYNDDLDASINVGQPSTYANFVADNTNYVQISKALSDCSVSSTAKYPDIIDHFMASNEIGVIPATGPNPSPSISGIYYLEKTINVSRPINYVANYTTTTSDHYPVNARFRFGLSPATITSVSSGNWSSPSTWNCNCVPTSASDVIIDPTHTVNVNAPAQAKTLTVKGAGTVNYLAPFLLSLGM